MININNYFKDQKNKYEFILLFTDGKNRADLLGIQYKHYSNSKEANKWYCNIKDVIEDPKATEVLERLYEEMIY